jgi:hypothetical protein
MPNSHQQPAQHQESRPGVEMEMKPLLGSSIGLNTRIAAHR